MALPHKPITKNEDPKLVCLPKSRIASGQIPVYISAFGKPIKTKNQMDTSVSISKILMLPVKKIVNNEKSKPKEAQITKACL